MPNDVPTISTLVLEADLQTAETSEKDADTLAAIQTFQERLRRVRGDDRPTCLICEAVLTLTSRPQAYCVENKYFEEEEGLMQYTLVYGVCAQCVSRHNTRNGLYQAMLDASSERDFEIAALERGPARPAGHA